MRYHGLDVDVRFVDEDVIYTRIPTLKLPARSPDVNLPRYGSIEPDPDNPRQSYLDYIESFPLNAEPEVGAHERALGQLSSVGGGWTTV